MPNIIGYVLAGGESSRMQDGGAPIDKALLDFHGETLLERALRKVEQVCGNAAILGGPPARCERLQPYGRVVPDALNAIGPLGGLRAALADAEQDWLLIVPVDLPLLPPSALQEMVDTATRDGGPSVCVMTAQECYQPLPVVLHRAAITVVDQALARGERKLMPVLREAGETLCILGIHVLPAYELTDEVTANLWFTNVNTPADLDAARQLAIAANQSARSASE